MTSWFYKSAGQRVGPVSALEINILIQSGQLAPNTLVWHQGLLDWFMASELDEFRDRMNHDISPPTVSPVQTEIVTSWPAAPHSENVVLDFEAKPDGLLRAEYPYDKDKLRLLFLGAIVFVVVIVAIALTPEKPGDRHPSMLFSWFSGALFGFVALAALPRLFSREPGLTVSKVGIHLPSYAAQTIPWLAVGNLQRVQSKHTDSINLELDPVVAKTIRRRGFRGWLYMVLHGSKAKASVSLKTLKGDPDRIFNQSFSFWVKGQEEAGPLSHETSSTAARGQVQAVEPVIHVGRQFFTYAVIALLGIVYAGELVFGVDASEAGSPSNATLFVLGGTFRKSIVEHYQWWRLFTAPFMHGGVIHLTFNCLSLWFAGKLLERLIGWRWFAAIFFASALGGSVASVWINAPNVIGVGASGGIVGLFAATIVISFRASYAQIAGPLRMGAGQLLLSALLPFVSAAKDGENIDYAAHFGGAVAGGVLALVLFVSWPRERLTPRFGLPAATFSLVFMTIAVGSLWPISRMREAWFKDPMADYFAGRYQKAAEGFAAEAEENGTNAPYYYLWRFLAQSRGDDRGALADLQSAANKVAAGKWPRAVYDLFLDKLSPAEMIAKAGNGNELCEAMFYSGEWYLKRGDVAEARQRFQTALSSCPTTFLEYEGAKGELARLGSTGKAASAGKPAPNRADGQTAKLSKDSHNEGAVGARRSHITRVTTDGKGRRTSQIDVVADGSSVTMAFDAASGKTLSVTRTTRAGIVTSAVHYDPLNAQLWLRVEQQHDAEGKKVSETQHLDAGGRADVIFTASGDQQQIKYYNAANTLAGVTDFDTANANAWAQIRKTFDAAGKVVSQVTVNDDGTKIQDNYDPANAQTWSTYQQTFDAAGRLTFIDQTNDNGTHSTATFDIANTESWSRYEQHKDSAGRLLDQSNFNDNGTKDVFSYDAANAATWAIYQQSYNKAGLLGDVDQTNDDGTHYTLTYDVANDELWTRYEQIKNSSNETLTRSNFNDDGTREVITYDVTNAQAWASKTDRYTAAGYLLSSTQLNDDMSKSKATYHFNGSRP
ncbi:membrane associated rhomboid family serine protease [Rhizobium azibense]|nr:membrane associated rhomboid family serine protease [Rhizobium azibense]